MRACCAYWIHPRTTTTTRSHRFAALAAAAATTTSSTRRMPITGTDSCRSYYTYQLGPNSSSSSSNNTNTTLYIPLTSYCNAVTLPQTRGPKFVLPAAAVAALCRVRDAEESQQHKKWEFWCRWLDQQDAMQTLPAPSETSYVAAIPARDDDDDEHQPPSVTTLLGEVQEFLQQQQQQQKLQSSNTTTTTIVIGGEGEPTLRWHALIRLLEQLGPMLQNYQHHTPAATTTTNNTNTTTILRIHTNGLRWGGDAHRTDQLLAVCGRHVNGAANHVRWVLTVPLMSHDPDQYDQLMRPLLVNNDDDNNNNHTPLRPHERVQECVRAAVRSSNSRNSGGNSSVEVELTAVQRTDVDRIPTEALAESLLLGPAATTAERGGIGGPVRWRPYFA